MIFNEYNVFKFVYCKTFTGLFTLFTHARTNLSCRLFSKLWVVFKSIKFCKNFKIRNMINLQHYKYLRHTISTIIDINKYR